MRRDCILLDRIFEMLCKHVGCILKRLPAILLMVCMRVLLVLKPCKEFNFLSLILSALLNVRTQMRFVDVGRSVAVLRYFFSAKWWCWEESSIDTFFVGYTETHSVFAGPFLI